MWAPSPDLRETDEPAGPPLSEVALQVRQWESWLDRGALADTPSGNKSRPATGQLSNRRSADRVVSPR